MKQLLQTLIVLSILSAITCLLSDNSSAEAEVPRIIGGTLIGANKYPHVAGYYANRYERLLFKCGASIISPTYLITAAHCVNRNMDLGAIRAGSVFREKGGQVVNVKQAFLHELYKITPDHDFALLQLERPLELNRATKTIQLPEKNFEIKEGESVFVAGWGKLGENGLLSRRLMGVTLKVFNTKKCVKIYDNLQDTATENHICTFSRHKDACNGDSGGGLIHKSILVGVVSFGHGCARDGIPGGFSKVSMVVDWIRRVMAQNP